MSFSAHAPPAHGGRSQREQSRPASQQAATGFFHAAERPFMGDTTAHLAATRLTDLLTAPGTRPAFGVYQIAGFPDVSASASVAEMLVRHGGVDFVAIGVPHLSPVLGSPEMREAHRCALRGGTQMADVMTVVRHLTRHTAAPVVVMTYFAPVVQCGYRRFAAGLADAGAAGAMILDLPLDEAPEWVAAASDVALHTPQLVSRRASDLRLRQVSSMSTGWVHVPAANASNNPQQVDVTALRIFCQRLRAYQHTPPVVTGVGLCCPEQAAAISPYVDGIVIGSPLIRPLLEQSDWRGACAVAKTTLEFSRALPRPLPAPREADALRSDSPAGATCRRRAEAWNALSPRFSQ
ncbi:tryptophan synthase subunit alpha [Streptomyces albus]|uniref:tryptophan synthase subunit alpha n=1 Tax=Streptomyces albus TaxID=1888 RepID=UPI003406C214